MNSIDEIEKKIKILIKKKEELEAKTEVSITQLKAFIDAHNINARTLKNNAVNEIHSLLADVMEKGSENQTRLLSTIGILPQVYSVELDHVKWNEYAFDEQHIPYDLVVGSEKQEIGKDKYVTFPIAIPFMSTESCFFIDFKNKEKNWSLDSLHSIVCRLNAMLPHTAQFCILDPKSAGGNFPYINNIPHKRNVGRDLTSVLDDVIDDIDRINRSYLDMNTKRLVEVERSVRSGEKFEFIVAANFPTGFDKRAIEKLAAIANTGARAGKYVILQYDSAQDSPDGPDVSLFNSLVSMRDSIIEQKLTERCYLGTLVSTKTISAILEGLKGAKQVERNVEFDDIYDTNPEQWWQRDASSELRAKVGGTGSRKDELVIWFGDSQEGRNVSHGMLGATTGAGKSNLYHAFILGLACQYSPEDLKLYLIDGKQGVEFQAYSKLPHAAVVSLKTSPQLARSVMAELVAEMERRNEMFQAINVVDFNGYRKMGSPSGKIPRIMLIIDEYQTLFEDDREGLGSDLMYKLASQARSSGIHMFVGSQRFGAPGMQKQQAIFGNIHLRVGMKMTEADVKSLQEFGREGKQLIKACKVPGQVVINDAAGDDERNIAGQVAKISEQLRSALISKLSEKWYQSTSEDQRHNIIVLNGTGQPNLIDNPKLNALARIFADRPSETHWAKYANMPHHQGGLEENEWYTSERPSVFWIGQELNIHGHTAITFKRRINENLLIVGDNNDARLGIMTSMLSQLLVNFSKDQYQATIVDKSVKGSPWHGQLERVINSLYNNENIQLIDKNSEFKDQLTKTAKLLSERKALDDDELEDLPCIFIFIYEAQRIADLQKDKGQFGVKELSETGQLLHDLVESGPAVGIHIILAFDAVTSLNAVFETRELDRFRHKVAMQMSEKESFSMITNDRASKLQRDGSKPIYAIYADQKRNFPIKFKPYCFVSSDELSEQAANLSQLFSGWLR